jgi:hypothetical protein
MENSILVYDIETNSPNPEEADLKVFGAYSYVTKRFYQHTYQELDKIKALFDNHKVLVGFNNINFDNIVLSKIEELEDIFRFKSIVDLYIISADRKGCKQRIFQLTKKKLKKYTLNHICQELRIAGDGKGDIDYDIFKKDYWTKDELKTIWIYLKQDLKLTKNLFEWFVLNLKPLADYLPLHKRYNYTFIKASASSLAYQILQHSTGGLVEYAEKDPEKISKTYSGGHHILPPKNTHVGELVMLDFASQYPMAIMMFNLLSPNKLNNKYPDHYDIKGSYDKKTLGKKESIIYDFTKKKLAAKFSGNKILSNSYKIVINSLYGTLGSPIFKNMYDTTAARDCTSIGRTWLRRFAKTLHIEGFEVVYGCTDSALVKISEESNFEELMLVVKRFEESIKSETPIRIEEFSLGIDAKMRFIWFPKKKKLGTIMLNNYIYIDDNNKIKYKGLFGSATHPVVMKLFEGYMSGKILSETNVSFTEDELRKEIVKILTTDVKLSGKNHKVKSAEKYSAENSLQAQISRRYGEGTHFMIPNSAMIGVGKDKGTKKRKPVRHCTIEEFEKNNLMIGDININNILKSLDSFIEEKQYTQNKLMDKDRIISKKKEATQDG